LVLKYGVDGELAENMPRLYQSCRVVADVFNVAIDPKTPYIGDAAFYTEAGMHQSGMKRDPGSYPHCNPEAVGNWMRFGLSDQSGKEGVLIKATELGIVIPDELLPSVMNEYRMVSDAGVEFGIADASFELFLMRQLGMLPNDLEFIRWRMIVEKNVDRPVEVEASLKLIMHREEEGKDPQKLHDHEGDGPVNALDGAIRRTLKNRYPLTLKVKITDFKVRMVDQGRGSASRVRALITFSDGSKTWSTLAVHENILEASWEALWDAYLYKIHVIDAEEVLAA